METSSFWAYLAILRKRLWLILLLFALTMVLILARAWATPPTYRSSLVLQVIPLEPEEVTLFTRLNNVSTGDATDLILFQFGSLVRSPRIAERASSEAGVSMPAGELADSITFERDPAGDLVTVAVTAGSPEDAEKLVLKQVELALAEFRAGRARPSFVAGQFLETELVTAEQELAEAREALLRFKLDNRLEFIDREITAEQDSIRGLTAAQEAADLEAIRLTALSDALSKQSDDARARAAALPADSADAAYWRRLAEDLNTSSVTRLVDAEGQKALARSSVGQLSRHQANIASLITLLGDFRELEDVTQERQASRDFLAEKAREARLKQSQSENIGYLQVIGSPATPRSQLASRTLQTALLGGGISLLAGVILAFLLEFAEQALRRRPSAARRSA